jgi:hypothetical protein
MTARKSVADSLCGSTGITSSTCSRFSCGWLLVWVRSWVGGRSTGQLSSPLLLVSLMSSSSESSTRTMMAEGVGHVPFGDRDDVVPHGHRIPIGAAAVFAGKIERR